MNYNEFMKNVEEFVFAESQPEKADIIFVPGNGFPDMAEKAASLYREGYAPYILPSGRYSITLGKFAGVQSKKEIYGGDYETECKTYHARRSLMYYQLLYPETVIMVCPACPDGITRENWRETETGVEAVTGEIDRIVKQFCLMLGNR